MPEPDKRDFLDETIAVERIQQIVANARTVWFALIGFLAFIGLTLVSVQDIDFYSIAATTDLPIVNIAIPTTTFFWSAAWLATVLHTYFHLYLVKLWDVLATAPRTVGQQKLGDRVFPWLVVDWALRRRPDREQATTPRPMDWLADLVTWLVIWLATPLVLAGFWWRSMPAHLAWLTLAIGAALVLSCLASLAGWHRAKLRLSAPGVRSDGEGQRYRIPTWWAGTVIPVLIIASFSVGRTTGEIGPWVVQGISPTPIALGPLVMRGISPAPIDLVGAQIAEKPADWHNRDLAERRFRVGWCRDYGLPANVCELPWNTEQTALREKWCEANGVGQENCAARFTEIDAAFDNEWREERTAYLLNIGGPDLRNRDLRGASAAGAFLAGVDLFEARLDGVDFLGATLERTNLSGAHLEGAILSLARLERARLSGASLDGAGLSLARLEGAYLNGAKLKRADLSKARLQGADLSRAELEWADLREAELEGAYLRMAQLEGAILFGARLDRAILFETQLEGADLRGAHLPSADWAGATIGASPVHSANFTGGRNLRQSQLDQAIGDRNTILPRDIDGNQLQVWSCWEEPPDTLDALLRRWPAFYRTQLRSRWLCGPGEKPEEIGTPAAD